MPSLSPGLAEANLSKMINRASQIDRNAEIVAILDPPRGGLSKWTFWLLSTIKGPKQNVKSFDDFDACRRISIFFSSSLRPIRSIFVNMLQVNIPITPSSL